MNDLSNRMQRVQVLAVSPLESDHTTLAHIFGHTAWDIRNAHSLREASVKLLEDAPPIVLCEDKLPDGTWKDLYALIESLNDKHYLIVTSQFADERLWAEVLNLGAYDVLAKPYRAKEVFDTIGQAWRHCMDCRKTVGRSSFSSSKVYTAGAVA
jgi:DNA-binding NtrC family response regulator